MKDFEDSEKVSVQIVNVIAESIYLSSNFHSPGPCNDAGGRGQVPIKLAIRHEGCIGILQYIIKKVITVLFATKNEDRYSNTAQWKCMHSNNIMMIISQ